MRFSGNRTHVQSKKESKCKIGRNPSVETDGNKSDTSAKPAAKG
jgi:hypothetical protein